MDTSFEMERFIKQDLVTKRVTSFSLGNVWFYCFRETCIGFRDLETEEAVFLDVTKEQLSNDNYTSRHLITTQIVKEAIDEGNTNKTPVLLQLVEFNNAAFKAGFNSFQRHFDKALLGTMKAT